MVWRSRGTSEEEFSRSGAKKAAWDLADFAPLRRRVKRFSVSPIVPY
jgi:hypothetical protein